MQLQHTRGNAEADEDAKSNYIIEYIILYIYRTEEHYLKGRERTTGPGQHFHKLYCADELKLKK